MWGTFTHSSHSTSGSHRWPMWRYIYHKHKGEDWLLMFESILTRHSDVTRPVFRWEKDCKQYWKKIIPTPEFSKEKSDGWFGRVNKMVKHSPLNQTLERCGGRGSSSTIKGDKRKGKLKNSSFICPLPLFESRDKATCYLVSSDTPAGTREKWWR